MLPRDQRGNKDGLENQISSRNTHSFGDVRAGFCAPKRNCDARRSVGTVSSYGWRVGDFRVALRETEVELRGRIGEPTRITQPSVGRWCSRGIGQDDKLSNGVVAFDERNFRIGVDD